MIQLSINDMVYVSGIGYGEIVACQQGQKIVIPTNQPITASQQTLAPLFDQPSTEPLLSKQPSIVAPPQIVTVRLIPTQILVYTPSSNLKTTVQLCIKVFFGQRKRVSVNVPVSATMDNVKKLLFERCGKDIANYFNIRLLYPGVELRQLTKPVVAEQLSNKCKLVLLAQPTFCLGLPAGTTNMKLSKNNLTLTKAGNEVYSTAFSNVVFDGDGTYYWQVRIDSFSSQEDIFIGVADKGINCQACPTHAGAYWGYMPLSARKFSNEDVGNLIKYGNQCKLGDTVGVMLRIFKGVGTLYFFKGPSSHGIAFENIKPPVNAAVTLLGITGSTVQVTLDTKANLPPYDSI